MESLLNIPQGGLGMKDDDSDINVITEKEIQEDIEETKSEDDVNSPPEPIHTIDFQRVSIADIYTNPSPEPSFVWNGRVPKGHVTLLGAHGGVGKSMLALQLAVAVSIGVDFLGASTTQGPVLFFSGEDGTAVLRHRLAYVASHFNVLPELLAKSLMILDATETPELYREVSQFGVKTGETTTGFNRLSEIIKEVQPSLIIVDNASDVFAASENDRAQVRHFMRSLRFLFTDETEAPAILLLAHIQKQAVGNRGVESYSGSTAWHNSARSRLALTADKDDPTRLTLSHDKLNLGPRTAEPLHLARTHTGLLVLDDHASNDHGDSSSCTSSAHTTLLIILADFIRHGDHVPVSPNAPRTNAWATFSEESAFIKRTYKKASTFFAAFRQLEREGYIEKGTYLNEYRKPREEWLITEKGIGFIEPFAPSAPSESTSEVGTLDAVGAEVSMALAPSAPTSGARVIGGSAAQEVGANIPDSLTARKSVCPRCDGEGCEFCQPKEGTRADGSNPRARGTNPRATGTNPRTKRQRR